MKKHVLTSFLILASFMELFAQNCANELFFSEYIEGISNNKAFEVYNPTSGNVNLENYIIYRFNNGSPNAQDSLKPQGALASGDVFVIGNPSAVAGILSVSDTLHTASFYNGDDVLMLINKTTNDTLDIIGILGNDPGTNWPVGTGATSEYTLVRKANVCHGTKIWTICDDQWDVYPQNTITYLGTHSMNGSTFNNMNELICQGESILLGGSWQSESGIYYDTLCSIWGCDSIIVTTLTVAPIDTNVVITGDTLKSLAVGATYQWIDCNTMQQVPGETDSIFIPGVSGFYAVVVTKNGCTDTSSCYQFVYTSLPTYETSGINVYPNPVSSFINLNMPTYIGEYYFSLYSLTGTELVSKTIVNDNKFLLDISQYSNGIYFIHIQTLNNSEVIKIVKH